MISIADVAGVGLYGEEKLEEFPAQINSVHPSIKFTIKSTKSEGPLAFLDTLITAKEETYTTELYTKLMASGIILR